MMSAPRPFFVRRAASRNYCQIRFLAPRGLLAPHNVVNSPPRLFHSRRSGPKEIARRNTSSPKRAMDIVGALALLVVLLSPMLLTVLVILDGHDARQAASSARSASGSADVDFECTNFARCGWTPIKLQHLVQNEKDGPIFKNRHDPRVTRLGRWLRKTSIDEMPQLVNVLAGRICRWSARGRRCPRKSSNTRPGSDAGWRSSRASPACGK